MFGAALELCSLYSSFCFGTVGDCLCLAGVSWGEEEISPLCQGAYLVYGDPGGEFGVSLVVKATGRLGSWVWAFFLLTAYEVHSFG